MNKKIVINSLNKDFESIKKIDKNNIEYWQARELMPILGYSNWQKAEEVIGRAAAACINSGQAVDNHFNQTVKMVSTKILVELCRKIYCPSNILEN
ncbi:MAG: BRO family protein [Patescibacteria group bacterium]